MLRSQVLLPDGYYPVWGTWGQRVALRNKQVMVIDDDQSQLEKLHGALSLEGFKVNKCLNGELAVRQAKELKPDLILLDLKMNSMNGMQVALELAGKPETFRIPIIGMSGFFTRGEIGRFLSMGLIRACVTKPIQMHELVNKIANYL